MRSFLFVLGFVASLSAHGGGGTVGNGGDSYVMEFTAVGERVVRWLEQEKINELSGFNAENFSIALRAAKISSTEDSLLLDGVEKDAINYPATREIIINRSRWRSIESDFHRIGLVTHEILGLMKISDDSYKVSIPVASRMAGVDPKSAPYFKVNYTCESTAVATKSDGSESKDIQKVVLGYNPSSIGIREFVHSIDGQTFYMAADISAGSGMDRSDPSREYWSVEYYWLAAPIKHFKILGVSSFNAYGSELPTKFELPFRQNFSRNSQTKISFNLTCKRN